MDSLDILLVEDVASDAILTVRALDKTGVPYNLRKVKNGSEVLSSIFQQRHYGKSGLPNLIILDLGLPIIDGFEVLSALAAKSEIVRTVPIIVLTGYPDLEDLKKTYDLRILACIKKPCNAEQLLPVLKQLAA